MSAMLRRALLTAIAAPLGVLLMAIPARADFDGDVGGGGTRVTLKERQLRQLNKEYVRLRAQPGPRLEYKSLMAVCGEPLDSADIDEECWQKSFTLCRGGGAQGDGPMMIVYRRWVDPSGKPVPAPGTSEVSDWEQVGTTCLPDLVPGAVKRPSVAMIINAFHLTPWAKGTISTQPKGDVTLVNLKTFYQVNWSAAGFQPGEVESINPATMYGFRVEVRPKLVNYVYHFGDGATDGPTTSPGGVWPDGDVIHTYTRRGEFTSYVEVTFGADFRVNGGPWIEVPDTVTVAQPGTVVTVKEKRAVLVNN